MVENVKCIIVDALKSFNLFDYDYDRDTSLK